jgi:broad specificity phosphatase PhoE
MNPQKIIVMRHAESQEDVDKTVYAHTADLDVALSPRGEKQCVDVSHTLSSVLGKRRVHFYISPGSRLRQTYDLMTSHFPKDLHHSFSVETLLLKQYWGDVTVENRREIEIERYREGVLVYRFPNGESGIQLVDRFRLFANNLRGEFAKKDFPENIVILTHGFEMRVFLMIWFGWSGEYFERVANPKNCEMVTLHLKSNGSYSMDREMRAYDPANNPNHVARSQNRADER